MDNTTGVPRHVAFIMDGNGRWAEQRHQPRLDGHRTGVKNIRPIIKYLHDNGVKYATLYTFSTENWNRPEQEVLGLFNLLEDVIEEESRELHKNNVKIRHVGHMEGIAPSLQEAIKRALKLTSGNSGLTLGFAFNYGGRAEILDAMRKIIARNIPLDSIDEDSFGEYLYTADFPDVDLVIRTGGEFRTSNFLIWQSAYAEYYFTPVLWPDFNESELKKALLAYSQRKRRFGGLESNAACSEKDS